MSRPTVLGYTRTGKPVLLPARGGAEVKITDWSRGDHADAAHILTEHGERERDQQIAAHCAQAARAHRAAASHRTGVRGGAEGRVLSGRRR